MHARTKVIIRDIKALKVQGARNVAKAALQALGWEIENSKARNLDGLYKELLEVATALARSRPTEPMMRNTIEDVVRHAFLAIRKQARSVKEARGIILRREEALLKDMDRGVGRLAEYGARLIPDEACIVTHCHSSSVTAILKKAKDQGKNIEVIACETRPRYQGRLTATELAKHRIKVSLGVDGVMNQAMKKADIVLVGADAITSRGDLINKVGTATLAHIAQLHDVSFYSAAELYKYSPLTFQGYREPIEQREAAEVWERPPKGVKIWNPAFDVTAARYVSGYITDAGVVAPGGIFALAMRKLAGEEPDG